MNRKETLKKPCKNHMNVVYSEVPVGRSARAVGILGY